MLFALLSPAKRLDFAPPPPFAKKTRPRLLKETSRLAARAKQLSRTDLRRLMDISPKLADLNFARFQNFDIANRRDTSAAVYTFAGDVYVGLDAATLTAEDIAFAQEHIGILSGLYGLLRPLDAIQPYRLEMGTRLRNDRGADLYAFWRDSIAQEINAATEGFDDPAVVNLASDEYWSAVDEKALHAPVIQPVFREIKGGKARVISFLAKKARGLMARHIVRQRLDNASELKAFRDEGYVFDAAASDTRRWVFARKAR